MKVVGIRSHRAAGIPCIVNQEIGLVFMNSTGCITRRPSTIPRGKGLVISLLALILSAACTAAVKPQETALIHLRLGESLLQEGRPTQALAELIKANDQDPNNPVIRNTLGVAYLAKGMVRQAVYQFEKALELDPEYAEAYNNLGAALLRDGRAQEAVTPLTKALSRPTYATPHFAYFNLGQAYFALKDYEKARHYYEEAVKLSPSYSLAYHGLGLAWKASGNLKEAAEALKKALEHAPKFAQAHFDLGEVFVDMNQTSLARLAFQEVLHLAPESDLAKKARERLNELK